MKIGLIRHGITDYNEKNILQGWKNIPLNVKGKTQVEKLCIDIKNEWDVIYSSDLKRAKQTAEIVNEKYNIPLFTAIELRERCWGQYEGQRNEKRLIDYSLGVESREEFEKRIQLFLKENLNDQRFMCQQVRFFYTIISQLPCCGNMNFQIYRIVISRKLNKKLLQSESYGTIVGRD